MAIERTESVGAKKRDRAKSKGRAGRHWEAAGPAVDQKLMKALGHPLRIALLTILNDRVASPTELAKELAEGLSQVSYHVKVLKDFDMIELVKTEPRRGAVEHYYKAVEDVFIPSWQMKLMPKSAQRTAFGGVLAELEQDLVTALQTGTFDKRPDWVVARDPRIMDDQGRKEAERAAAEYLEKYRDIGLEAARRIANGESDPVPTTAALLVFGSAQSKKAKTARKSRRKA